MTNRCKRQIRSNGQGVMEYMILTSLIGIFCLMAVKQFGQEVKYQINHIKRELSERVIRK
ncbi:MAG: hypothetical protein HN353_10490 [Bdellovibrionales bacterium]|jgi:hypothetical protein|nr:hypothetical protein [Bdellovibrionales bacterium]MBT3524721.1 hypothetical protein [Bdellovibrionales bacterium]MBT7668763.1 hypothetical protein [Bdellovibrionales bacterium]MBT7766940.1 hypothetical protein [Bdellovibrionales bacterium]